MARESDIGQHLAERDFCQILDRLPRTPARVILSGVGEPLLNPRFFALTDIMAECGIKCEFYTNGTLLTQRIGQEIIPRSNINVINISCDGAQKATFESLRVGADFENWKQSVGEFLAQAKRQRGQTLSTGMNIVASKQNLSEMGNLFRLAAKLGFDNVYVMHPIPVDETAALMCPSPDELSTLRQEDLEELAGSLGLKVTCFFRRPPSPHKTGPRCMQPWEHLFIPQWRRCFMSRPVRF